jgi:methylated-DNA-[protein]-cysteine S-methyltransferase
MNLRWVEIQEFVVQVENFVNSFYMKQEKTFTEKVRDVVRKIQHGKTMTYGQVAAKAGNSKASRVVGSVMKANYDPEIPCHRVIRSDGRVGDYNRGGSVVKLKLLKEEGALR